MGFTDIERNIDIVFCIDGGGRMASIIDKIKDNLKRLYESIDKNIKDDVRIKISSVRVKLIVFRDYEADCNEAMEITDFFKLPEEQDKFEKAIDRINAHGGGDGPQNGFEALYYAMKSDWVTGLRDRQTIVLLSNEDALDLKARADSEYYPKDMVDYEGLWKLWSCVNQSSDLKLRDKLRRLIFYVPKGTKYEEFCDNVRRAWMIPSDSDSDINFNVEDIFNSYFVVWNQC